MKPLATLATRYPQKRVLITGVTAGLGEALALQFASAGFRVAVASRNPEKVAATCARVKRAGGEPDQGHGAPPPVRPAPARRQVALVVGPDVSRNLSQTHTLYVPPQAVGVQYRQVTSSPGGCGYRPKTSRTRTRDGRAGDVISGRPSPSAAPHQAANSPPAHPVPCACHPTG